MSELTTIALRFIDGGKEGIEIVADKPIRVIRIGEPGIVGHTWESQKTADLKRLIEILADALKVMDDKYYEEFLRKVNADQAETLV